MENELLFPVSQVSQRQADPTPKIQTSNGEARGPGYRHAGREVSGSPSPGVTCMPRPPSQASGSPPFLDLLPAKPTPRTERDILRTRSSALSPHPAPAAWLHQFLESFLLKLLSLLLLFLQQEMENLTPSSLSQSETCMILQLQSDHILIGGVTDPKDSFLPPL